MTTPRRYAAVLALSLALSTAALAADQLALRTLSNRADVVSGGDALVEIVLPAGAHPDEVQVTLAGRDITSAFAVRTDGRLVGLVGGLAPGANDLFARIVTSAGTSARLTITNHPVGGPVFSGAQLQGRAMQRLEVEAQLLLSTQGERRLQLLLHQHRERPLFRRVRHLEPSCRCGRRQLHQ